MYATCWGGTETAEEETTDAGVDVEDLELDMDTEDCLVAEVALAKEKEEREEERAGKDENEDTTGFEGGERAGSVEEDEDVENGAVEDVKEEFDKEEEE